MTRDCSLNSPKNTSLEHVVYKKWFFVFVLTFKTIYVHNMFWAWTCKSMNNLLSYCGLVDARISTSEKDLPVQELIGNNWKITGQLFATQYFSISETKMVSMFRQSHSHPFSGLVLRIRPETVWGQTSQPVRRIQKHIRYHRQPSNFCPGLVLYGFCLKHIRNC